jgi:hypothetical protein
MQPPGSRPTDQLVWRKASLCASGECIEVAQLDGMIVMRDSKDPGDSMLHYTADEFRSFVGSIKAGEYDGLAI